MLELTLKNALVAYRVYIQNEHKFHSETEISHIVTRIGACTEYLHQGNTVNGAWLEENHMLLSKVVSYAHKSKHRFDNEMDEEHRDLNNLVLFYKKFYEKCGIDPKYTEI